MSIVHHNGAAADRVRRDPPTVVGAAAAAAAAFLIRKWSVRSPKYTGGQLSAARIQPRGSRATRTAWERAVAQTAPATAAALAPETGPHARAARTARERRAPSFQRTRLRAEWAAATTADLRRARSTGSATKSAPACLWRVCPERIGTPRSDTPGRARNSRRERWRRA
jgi:hypothetical protein